MARAQLSDVDRVRWGAQRNRLVPAIEHDSAPACTILRDLDRIWLAGRGYVERSPLRGIAHADHLLAVDGRRGALRQRSMIRQRRSNQLAQVSERGERGEFR